MYCIRIWPCIAFSVICITGVQIGDKCKDAVCTTAAIDSTACAKVTNCLLGSCSVDSGGGVVCKGGCKDGFSGRQCNIPCLPNCLKCGQRRADDCIKCKERHVGEYCQHECPISCPEGCFRNGVCRNQCSDNHICGDKCLPRCKLCNFTSGICQKCDIHYTGDNCETDCTNCVGKCSSSGCLGGCIDGFHGENCNIPCSENCFPFCLPKPRATGACLPACDQHTGACLNGCKDGFRGHQCTDGCSSRCQDMKCNQTTGHCLKCVTGYYKETCHLRCYNCKDDVCEMKTGLCFECKDGYYGVDCKHTCTSCLSGLCERNGGRCIDILQVTTFDATTSKTPSHQSAMYPLVIGLIVFGVIAAILICILSHRLCRLSARAGENQERSADNVLLRYRRNSYNEINEEDMDPSAGQRPPTEAYYSPLVRQENDNDPSVSRVSSSDNDSLIIPGWFARVVHDSTSESSYE